MSFAWLGIAAARNDDVVAVLLICLVISIVVSALVMRRIIRAELRRKRAVVLPPSPAAPSAAALLEPPMRWLAVRVHDVHLVQSALAVQNPRECLWSDALVPPFEPRLFISPPTRGWIFVIGSDLPDPADDVDQCFIFLTRLSQRLGEVQFFVRNRAVSHHGWVRMDAGKVVRAYVWAGETLWNQGNPTPAERALKLRCLPYNESPDVLGLAERDVLAVNTDRVSRLAGEWSIDPTAVDADTLDGKGIAGDLLHSKLH